MEAKETMEDDIMATLQRFAEELRSNNDECAHLDIVNAERLKQFCDATKKVAAAIRMDGVTLSCGITNNRRKYGTIKVTGKNVMVTDCKMFADAVAASDAFDITHMSDDTTTMSFAFHGIVNLAEAE